MAHSETDRVRPTVLSGSWYPRDALVLRRTVEGYLSDVEPETLPGSVVALVAPHAGYAYSGPTAAHAFAQVRRQAFERVIILGPIHRLIRGARIAPFMVASEVAYTTPLGEVAVDHPFLADVGNAVALKPVHGDQEHSLEIQLPFLQVALGEFRLAPIMLGDHISETGALQRAGELAAALAERSDDRTILVASTDLSHLDNYAEVVHTDKRLAQLVGDFDLPRLERALASGEVQACGAMALVVALRFATMRGAAGARVLSRTTSGDVTGRRDPGTYTVGYMAAAFHK